MIALTFKEDIEVRVGNRVFAQPKTLAKAMGVFVALSSPENYGLKFGYVVTKRMADSFADRVSAAITGHTLSPQPAEPGKLWADTKAGLNGMAGALTATGGLGDRVHVEVRKWAMSQHLVRLTGSYHNLSNFRVTTAGRIGEAQERGYSVTVTEQMRKFFLHNVLSGAWPEGWAKIRAGTVLTIPPRPFWSVTLKSMIADHTFDKILKDALEERLQAIAQQAASGAPVAATGSP